MFEPSPVPFADYGPDASEYDPSFSSVVANVEPHQTGWGPFPDWAAIGTSLGAQCRGAITVRKTDGSTALYAGTSTGLYLYNTASANWTDVTRLVGGAYAVEANWYWSFHQFGDQLIACNGVDANQYIDVDVGANFAALANSPIAYWVSSMGDHLLLGRLASNLRGIAWSGVNDATFWTYGENGSDEQTLPDGGDVQGIVGSPDGAVILQQAAMREIVRTGGTFLFEVKVIHEKLGCSAPFSITKVMNTFFWYDQSGFYMGKEAKPIGAERVNRYVGRTCSEPTMVRGAVDPNRNIIWWIMDLADSTVEVLGFDWVVGKWTRLTIQIDYIFSAISPGYTIDDLTTLGYTFDTTPYPLDSPFWRGTGIQSLAGFSSAGAFGYFDGANAAATMETNDIEFAPGWTSYVHSFRAQGNAAAANSSGQIGTRQFPGATISWSASVSADDETGRIWKQSRGSTHRFRLSIAAEAEWENMTHLLAWHRRGGMR